MKNLAILPGSLTATQGIGVSHIRLLAREFACANSTLVAKYEDSVLVSLMSISIKQFAVLVRPGRRISSLNVGFLRSCERKKPILMLEIICLSKSGGPS